MLFQNIHFYVAKMRIIVILVVEVVCHMYFGLLGCITEMRRFKTSIYWRVR